MKFSLAIVAVLPLALADISCYQGTDGVVPVLKDQFAIKGANVCVSYTDRWTKTTGYVAGIKCEDYTDPQGKYLDVKCCKTDFCNAPANKTPSTTPSAPAANNAGSGTSPAPGTNKGTDVQNDASTMMQSMGGLLAAVALMVAM